MNKPRAIAEEKHWHAKGHDTWWEYGVMQHAPMVDRAKFGDHSYNDGTSDCAYSDCAYKCGCWMGPTRSGGPVDPFGPCPNNPIPEEAEQ